MKKADEAHCAEEISNAVLAIEDRAEVALDPMQRALLAAEVSWLEYRGEFRRQMIKDGFLKHPWRSVFEADMIFMLIGHKWLHGEILTVKEIATYFEAFTSDVTITRHVDDMVAAGTLVRTPDPQDRRRQLLMPTQRLFEIGRIFLQARKEIACRHGFLHEPSQSRADDRHQSASI